MYENLPKSIGNFEILLNVENKHFYYKLASITKKIRKKILEKYFINSFKDCFLQTNELM